MIGKRIKLLRTNKEITQKELSEYLGLTPKMISFYEKEERFPPHDIITKIADYFKVTTDYLLGRTDDPNLNNKDEKNIQKDLKQIIDDFKTGEDGPVFYNGEELDEDELYLIEQAMEIALKTAKVKNKEKYTPNKYKK